MNTTSVGNVPYPFSAGSQLVSQRGTAVSVGEAQIEEGTPGLRRLADRRPNQAHAVLTYNISTLQRTSDAGANVDIYV